mmetsp:Transcript_66207/g.170449  ORF Transcript_66207/g.170449 Transcript_66207/m.170449 type:complete len:420 (-) Transcript_66207:262-1521(-)
MRPLDLAQAAVAEAGLVEDEDALLPVAGGRDVVADHHLDGLPPQHADAVQLPEVPQHHQEAQVVVEGAHHAALHGEGHLHGAAAGQDLGDVSADPAALGAALVDHLQVVRQVGLALHLDAPVPRPDAVGLLRRHREARVAHLQRPADALLEDDVERLAGDDLEDAPHHVEAEAVVPVVPGLALQRDLGQGVAPLLQGLYVAVARALRELLVDLVVGALDGRPRIVQGRAVPDAAGVGQELPQGDRFEARLRLPLPALRQHRHLLGRERGDKLGQGVVQVDVERGVLEEGHEGRGDEALRHGEEPHDGVARHLLLALGVREARVLVEDHPAGLHHAAGDSREVAHPGAPLEVLAHPLEGRGVHAHCLRRAACPLAQRRAERHDARGELHGLLARGRCGPARRQLLQQLPRRGRLRGAEDD